MCKFIFVHFYICSFPKDNERRRAWLSVLGLEEKYLPVRADICSEHFNITDFEIKQSGLRYLKKDAIPKPYQQEMLLSSSR